MRKIYFSMLTLILMMVSGSAMAQADYTATFNVQWTDSWVADEQFFPAAEVAEKLGITTDALKAMLDANQRDTNQPFAILSNEEKVTTPYSADPIGWWIANDGTLGWSDDATWFVCTEYAEADGEELTEDAVGIIIGQMPGVFSKVYTDTALTATVYLVSGDKEVSFAVTQNIAAAIPSSLPDPATSFAALEVVGEYTATLDFTEGKQYEGKTGEVEMTDLYEKLGLTAETLDAFVADVTMVRTYQEEYNGEVATGSYILSDDLKPYVYQEGEGDGAKTFDWFGRYNYLNEKDEAIPYTLNGPVQWGAGATFYVHDLKLAEGKFSFTYGQYPGTMEAGAEDYVDFYICNGTKVVKLTLKANVEAAAVIDPTALVKVGEVNLDIEQEPAQSGYPTKTYTFDLAQILELLECEASEIDKVSCPKNESDLMDYPGVDDGWFDANGYACAWANGTFFLQPTGAHTGDAFLADGKLIIGQKGGAEALAAIQTEEDKLEVPLKLYFQKGQNYVQLNINLTVKLAKKADDYEWKEVGKGTYLQQFVVSKAAMPYEEKWTLDTELIANKIGTTDFTVYADKYVAGEVEGEGKLEVKKDWNCTPAPGFWYGIKEYAEVEGTNVVDASGWTAAGDNAFGYTLADGVITFYIFARPAGETYKANIYFVNEETGSYYRYLFTAQYVESVIPSNVVGEYEDTQEYTDEPITLDMKAVYDMLEIEDGDLELLWASGASTFIDNISFQGMLDGDGYVFDTDSGDDLPDDGITATYDEVDNTITIELNDENRYTEAESTDQNIIRLAFDYTTGDGDQAVTKRVIYTLTIVSHYTATGINSVKAEKATAKKAYNLAGQQVDKGYKGIVIENGRKVLRK